MLSAEQRTQRRSLIGSSDIAALVGADPFRTPLDVYAEKVLETGDQSSRFKKWGHLLEPVVAEAFAEETGLKVVKDGRTHIHPGFPFVGATPDYRIQATAKPLEIKTTDAWFTDQWGESGTDQIPDRVLVQVAWQMAVLDANECHVAVLLGGNELRTYLVTRDLELEHTLLTVGQEFWEANVLQQVPPPFTDVEAAERFLKLRYPTHVSNTMLVADSESADTIQLLLAERGLLAEVQERVDTLTVQLKSKIGEAAGMESPYGSVTWRKNKDGTKTDWEAVAKELGSLRADELADARARFTEPRAGARPFLVKPAKGPKLVTV